MMITLLLELLFCTHLTKACKILESLWCNLQPMFLQNTEY